MGWFGGDDKITRDAKRKAELEQEKRELQKQIEKLSPQERKKDWFERIFG